MMVKSIFRYIYFQFMNLLPKTLTLVINEITVIELIKNQLANALYKSL